MKKSGNIQSLLSRSYSSHYSGKLEVKWLNDRKVLDSPNANYSYGALEEVLDKGLGDVYADRAAPVLLLGLGGGCAIPLLRKKYRYYGKILAVELDAAIIEIASTEFGVGEHQPLELLCADAEVFVNSTAEKFGLIIIDLFLDLLVPEQFFSDSFWKDISEVLHEEGKVLFNAGVNNVHAQQINRLLENDTIGINFQKKEEVNGSNTLLFGDREKR